MDNTPSPLARRITRRIIEETGYNERPEQELLELVHENTKELRPLSAYAQSLKEIINRIIHGGESELKAIAASVGIAIADETPGQKTQTGRLDKSLLG